MRVALEHDEQPHAENGQDQDAVRVREPVPAVRELARDEAIARKERGDPGEVREARVGRQDQDQRRDTLDQVVERREPEDPTGQLGVCRLPGDRHDVEDVDEDRDADEEDDQNQAEGREHLPGVLGLRRPEGGDAIGHRLDAGERGAPRRERPQGQEQGQRFDAPPLGLGRRRPRLAPEPQDEPPQDHGDVGADEQIGRPREQAPCFPDPAEIRERDRQDPGAAQQDAVRVERWDRRGDRVDPRGGAHGHRQHVVDEERRAGDEARVPAQVLARHDVGPAALRVGEDRLPEGGHHDRDQDRDGERDRQGRAQSRGAGGHQNQEDGLGGVRDRRQRVGGEDRQAGDAAQALVLVEAGRDRSPDQDSLETLDGHRARRAGLGPEPPRSPPVAGHAAGVRTARAGSVRRGCRSACTRR